MVWPIGQPNVLNRFLILVLATLFVGGCASFLRAASLLGDIVSIAQLLDSEDGTGSPGIRAKQRAAFVTHNFDREVSQQYTLELASNEESLEVFELEPDTTYKIHIERNDRVVLGVTIFDANGDVIPRTGYYLTNGSINYEFTTGPNDFFVEVKVSDQFYYGGAIDYVLAKK